MSRVKLRQNSEKTSMHGISTRLFAFTIVLLIVLYIIQLLQYTLWSSSPSHGKADGSRNVEYHSEEFLILLEYDPEQPSGVPVDIIINGRKALSLGDIPVSLRLRRGDVLEIDATNGGDGVVYLRPADPLILPQNWPDELLIRNRRYRFPRFL